MYLWHLWASSFAIFYSFLCLIWTFTVRLALKAYFSSVHAAALGSVVGLVLWMECATPWILHRLLPVCSLSPWSHKRLARRIGMTLTMILLLLLLLISVLFTSLALAESNFDFDRFISACFYWGAVVMLLLKLLIIHRRQLEKRANRLGNTHTRDRAAAVIGMHLHMVCEEDYWHRPSASGIYLLKDSRKQRQNILIRHGFTTVMLLGFSFYVIALFGVFINEAMITHDRRLYPSLNTHVIQQEGHRPHRIHLRCTGKGNITVLIESDLARPALLAFPFLPHVLINLPKYRACVYDRLGYGWSDGREFDWFGIFRPESMNDHDLVAELLKADILKAPIVYVGHQFGGKFVINHAISKPKNLKAAILIDWLSFTNQTAKQTHEFRAKLQRYSLWSNLLPTGWLRVAWMIRRWNLSSWLNYSFKEVPKELAKEVKVSLMHGHCFEAAMHEGNAWLEKNVTAERLRLKRISRSLPVLLLERQQLLNCGPYCTRLKSAATTDDIMYTLKGAKEVAARIEQFLQNLT